MRAKSVSQITALERTRRQILQRIDNIPALPELVTEALILLAQPDREIQDLADLLERDPVLVGKMVGHVNSPFSP